MGSKTLWDSFCHGRGEDRPLEDTRSSFLDGGMEEGETGGVMKSWIMDKIYKIIQVALSRNFQDLRFALESHFGNLLVSPIHSLHTVKPSLDSIIQRSGYFSGLAAQRLTRKHALAPTCPRYFGFWTKPYIAATPCRNACCRVGASVAGWVLSRSRWNFAVLYLSGISVSIDKKHVYTLTGHQQESSLYCFLRRFYL